MKKSLLKLVVLIGVFAVPFLVKGVLAMPAYPEPEQYVQPDGSIIELYSYGDEHYNFVGDADGYMLEKNADGAYEYVTYEFPVMMMSLEQDSLRPANAVKGFDLCGDLPESLENVKYPYTSYPSVSLFSTDDTNKQTLNLITIAVEFADVKFSEGCFDGQSIYDMFFSMEDGVISVNNYYDEVSGGRMQFIPAFSMLDSDANADGYGKIADGVVKVLVDGNHPDPQQYSDSAQQDATVISIIQDALAAADEYIDFSEFDTNPILDINGKSFIYDEELVFCFIVAGYETSANSQRTDNSVWAHKYYVPGGVECDGITLLDYPLVETEKGNYYYASDYVMLGAMFDDTHPMGIGGFCHELAHVLGMPDLYNTKGNTNYDSIYTLSLMAKGSWCRKDASSVPSSMPSHLDAWCKTQLGWYNTGEMKEIKVSGLADGESVTEQILPALSDKTGYRYIKVRANEESEYFLLENRIFKGFDSGLKYLGYTGYPALTSSGIAVWHIDNEVISANIRTNTINTTSQPGISLVRSGFGLEDFYDGSKPLWAIGINRLPFFGSQSYPNSDLNTYTDSAESGVEISFLTAPSEEMVVEIGGNNVQTAVYYKDNEAAVHLFNNTNSDISVTPIIARYGENCLDDVISLSQISIAAGENAITTKETFDITSSGLYKVFSINLNTMKPAAKIFSFRHQ